MEGQAQAATTEQQTTTQTAPPAPAGASPGAPTDGVERQGGGSSAPEQKATQDGQQQQEGQQPAKKERVGLTLAQIMERDRALKRREQELDARAKGMEGQKGYLERLKEDPLAVLQEAGLDFRKVVELGLNGKKDPTVDEKLAALEAQIEADKQARAKELEDEARRGHEQKVRQHFNTIGETISKDAEAYELLNVWDGAPELVNEVMVIWHKEHGKVLSYEEACKLTEDGLHQQVTSKLLGTGKVKKYLEEQAAAASQSAGATDAEKGATKQKTQANGRAKEPAKTLNNAQESVVVHKKGAASDDERLARAAQALSGGGAAA